MLATLAQLKTWLRIGSSETSEDALLTACLQAASEMITAECRRTIEYADADLTEQFDGGTRELLLKAWPITSIVSVKYASDYGFDAAEALVAETDYHAIASQGAIVRLPLDWTWTEGIQVWQVVYRGGYWPADGEGDAPEGVSAVPGKLVRACVLQAAHLKQRAQDLGVRSESLAGGGGSLAFSAEAELLAGVKKLLVGERRV